MCAQIILSSNKVVDWPPLWKELHTQFTVESLYMCKFLFILYGMIMDLIVPVPGNRLCFTFTFWVPNNWPFAIERSKR